MHERAILTGAVAGVADTSHAGIRLAGLGRPDGNTIIPDQFADLNHQAVIGAQDGKASAENIQTVPSSLTHLMGEAATAGRLVGCDVVQNPNKQTAEWSNTRGQTTVFEFRYGLTSASSRPYKVPLASLAELWTAAEANVRDRRWTTQSDR